MSPVNAEPCIRASVVDPRSASPRMVVPVDGARQVAWNASSASSTGTTIRGLADLGSTTLALMHGSTYTGDNAAALHALADEYDRRIAEAVPA